MEVEVWIDESGDITHADGDIGDYNHERVVIEIVQRNIVENCQSKFNMKGNFDYGDYIEWDEFKVALAKAYIPIFYKSRPLFTKDWIKHQVNHDPETFAFSAAKIAGVTKEEWLCAEGSTDARNFAMKNWGWKTYRNGNIDTWRLTRADLQMIVSGIDEIADQFRLSDKRLNRTSFSINVFSNGRHFSLTYAQMVKWLTSPTNVPPVQDQDNRYDLLSKTSDKHLKDLEMQNMNPAYVNHLPGGNTEKKPGVHPFGDCSSFKGFLLSEGKIQGK